VKGRAATLHQMAGVIAQQGDVERALGLWKQSLEIKEKIGDVQGKAATLANMAWAAGQQGDRERERGLNLEAARALAALRAWLDMITVLGNLGASEDSEATGFLAQAFWLASRAQASIEDTIVLAEALFQKLDPAADASLSVAVAAVALSLLRGHQHPQREKFQEYALGMLMACATARQIPEDKLTEWRGSLGVNDPARWRPVLDETLESLVGDSDWLFDRSLWQEE
jgi:tetratricopeptide (TPR) repeat protein